MNWLTTEVTIAAVFGVGLFVGFFWWSRRKQDQIKAELSACQQALALSSVQLNDVSIQLKRSNDELCELRACANSDLPQLGVKTRDSLTTFLLGLNKEISQMTECFRGLRNMAAGPSEIVAAVCLDTRLIDRKERFAQYGVTLQQAQGKLEEAEEQLTRDVEMISSLIDRLGSVEVLFVLGSLELAAIEQVMQKLEDETTRQKLEEIRSRRIKMDFDNLLKMKDKLKEVERRIRNEPRNPKVVTLAVEPDLSD